MTCSLPVGLLHWDLKAELCILSFGKESDVQEVLDFQNCAQIWTCPRTNINYPIGASEALVGERSLIEWQSLAFVPQAVACAEPSSCHCYIFLILEEEQKRK